MSQFQPAHEAFTKQSPEFDDIDEQSPIIKWMRERTYLHIKKHITQNTKVLEVNAGTGIDAFTIANWGHEVLATDAAEGMLRQLNIKKSNYKGNGNVEIQKLNFDDFGTLNQQGFNFMFSNFGGLNCLDDFTKITHHLPNVLEKGALVTWVLISPYCLWEWLFAFKGRFGLAFRRLKRRNVKAHLEGVEFPTFFYTPSEVKADFGERFELIDLEGLATFTPPPYLDWIAKKYPKFYKKLTSLDEKTSRWLLFRTIGDHFIITLKFKG